MAAPPRHGKITFAICSLLCALFAVVAWAAVSGKSATSDEPSHAAIGWLMTWRHDYRVSPDVPPLWEYIVGLGIGRDAVHIDAASPKYRNIQIRREMSAWSDSVMYHTAGNDRLAIMDHARLATLPIGVMLGGLIGWWAWKLGGAVPAVIATFLYCLDPNFLGHAALAKNDVASALLYLAAAYAIWRMGLRGTALKISAAVILIAVAVGVKFSGVLLAPVLILSLGIRALLPQRWIVLGRVLDRRGPRLLAAAAICALAALVTYVGLWAAYAFRFNAGPEGLQLDMTTAMNRLRTVQLPLQLGHDPTEAEVAAWHPPLGTRVIRFAESKRLLPQAWAVGFIHSQIEDQGRRKSYLLGANYTGGKWYYFPLAVLFKTPLSTLAAAILAAGICVASAGKMQFSADKSGGGLWTGIAMSIPPLLYCAATVTANINIGLRHTFPIYAFVYIGMGLVLARLCRQRGGQIALAVLAIGLISETTGAFPNFIAFFNVALERDRLYLLSDSNFDWGQDLPLLAAWQKKHPDVRLYIDCFGRCDPAAYGIRGVILQDGYNFVPTTPRPDKPGIIAISATNLQLLFYADREKWKEIGLSPDSKPVKVLGTTIYLFEFK